MTESNPTPAPGKSRRKRGRPKKENAPVAAGPISVRATLKTGQTMAFTCFRQYEDGRFVCFLSPGAEGKVLQRRISLDALAMIEIEEFPVPQQFQQTHVYRQEGHFEGARPGVMGTYHIDGPPILQSQNTAPKPELSISPGMLAKKGLRSTVTADGTPMSELPDGSVVPVGFMS